MVLAKISSIMHEQILNLYVFQVLDFEISNCKKHWDGKCCSYWTLVFPHCMICKSFFILFYHLQVKFVCTFVKMLFILIINWISWLCAGKAGGKNVKMGCLPHSNWGDFVFSLLLVDLRLLRLHVTPLPVRLRLWVHWRTVCVHGPKWKSHSGATRR